MDVEFSLEEINKLFEYALKNSQSDVAGLALKVARNKGIETGTLLSKAIVDDKELQFKIVNALANFARYDQIEMIIELLQSDSTKVKLCSVACLELMRDPRALKALKKLIHESDSEEVKERVKIAYEKISRYPVPLKNNTLYTYKELTLLQDVDFAYAEIILHREITVKDVSVLVKLLSHPNRELRKYAEKTLINKGKEISNTFFKIIANSNAIITEELITILSNFKDPRGTHLIIKWLNEKSSHEDLGAIRALGKIGSEDAALYLAEVVVNNKHSYKELEALKKIDSPPESYLISEYTNNDRFRRTGAKLLVDILGKNALKPLLDGLQDRYREVRENAELGLTKLGKASIESLISLFNSSNDENLRLQICQIFGNICDKRALSCLNELVGNKNKRVHLAAIEAIGKVADPLSITALSQLIESADIDTCKQAVKGLGNQNHIGSIQLLVKKANHSNKEIRLEIISSLRQLAWNLKEGYSLIAEAFLLMLNDKEKEVADLVEIELIELGTQYEIVLKCISRALNNTVNQSRIKKIFTAIKNEKSKRTKLHDITTACRVDRRNAPFSPTIDIPRPITDAIQLSISAPRTVCQNRSFILDVWAYFDRDKKEIYNLARDAQRNEAIVLRSKGPVQVNRDTTLEVKIDIPDFKIKQKDTIFWGGTTGNCTFSIKVPSKIDYGFYIGTANFYVGLLLIAKLNFDIEVGKHQQDEADITTNEQKIKTAFASYASDDRDKVLGRIQGMLKLLPQLDIFLDVASLRSGENWESRLENEIKTRDVFYLFWSIAASKSTWVEKEWRAALLIKGIKYIDPVPLESPQNAPPPTELSSLHFNEWTLAFQK